MSEYELYEPMIGARDGQMVVYIFGEADEFTYFGFHANINEKIDVLQTGTINKEINKMDEENKAWVIFIKNIDLNYGDTVNYWIHVIRNGTAYYKTGTWVKKPVRMTPCMAPLNTVIGIYEENYKEVEDASVPPPPPEVEDNE